MLDQIRPGTGNAETAASENHSHTVMISESHKRTMITVEKHNRTVITLVALCCLFLGIAIGALVRGSASARTDNSEGADDRTRLTISDTPVIPDSLSVAFARAARQVGPSVVNIKVTADESYPRGEPGRA
ncbi:MAG TPA: hypothetical protein VJX67_27065 [Blastocatellia bacterium]|nr:hypothetical protein [Blastocatellia bacterium]